ncbi:MAG TPA: TetR/AcrR family transcriptional regulator [Chryseolinea sp.]|nr:TetR/AcrR family transcriptional regulator [Chryseolinea sp.]
MEESDVRRKIIKGAEGLFMKYGVRSISMDDIARHLAVSKKTLYQHFEDKEDIVTIASQSHIEMMTQDFERIRTSATDSIDELARISVCLKQNMEDMNPSLLFDLQKYHPRAWKVWLDHKHKFIRESVIRNLKQGIEEGYFRPEIDLEVAATMRLELVQLPFDDQVFPPSQFKLSEVQMQLFDHFVYGLLTDKGRRQYQKCKETQVELTNP